LESGFAFDNIIVYLFIIENEQKRIYDSNRTITMGLKLTATLIFILVLISTVVYFVRPPGEPPDLQDKREESIIEESLVPYNGELPGITWADDIHPIFVRNKCGHCHTRGKEVIAEGFEELALGIIDPEDENNAYYSYHELVYTEGPPQIQDGESLRDGQCCWPRDYPQEQQRRIWIGSPEQSVLMHKLEHDYYDRDRPPQVF
jgi:hypothetical protein